jgi:hypothetical protein
MSLLTQNIFRKRYTPAILGLAIEVATPHFSVSHFSVKTGFYRKMGDRKMIALR